MCTHTHTHTVDNIKVVASFFHAATAGTETKIIQTQVRERERERFA